MNYTTKILLGAMAAVNLLLLILVFTGTGVGVFGRQYAYGPVHYQTDAFNQGLVAGTAQQLSVSNGGAITQDAVSTFTNTITAKVATTTLGCLRIYQQGATTVASTTYYVMATTTVSGTGSVLYATSSKPTYCQ